jgi:hypothetical protein
MILPTHCIQIVGLTPTVLWRSLALHFLPNSRRDRSEALHDRHTLTAPVKSRGRLPETEDHDCAAVADCMIQRCRYWNTGISENGNRFLCTSKVAPPQWPSVVGQLTHSLLFIFVMTPCLPIGWYRGSPFPLDWGVFLPTRSKVLIPADP